MMWPYCRAVQDKKTPQSVVQHKVNGSNLLPLNLTLKELLMKKLTIKLPPS